MDRSFNAAAITFGVIALIVILWTDFKRNDLDQVGHYLAQMAPPASRPVHEQGFIKLARKLITDLPQLPTPEYSYVPPVCCIFGPMQAAHPSWTPFLWQLLSMIALTVSVYAIVRTHEDQEDWNKRSIILSFVSLAFLPVLMSLELGAVDIVLGVLPLSFGYYFLTKKKPVKAGLTLALTLFRPEFLLPALFLASTMIVDKKRQKGLISMAAALALLLLLDALFAGCAVGKELLRTYEVLDSSAISHGIAPQMNASFSGSIMLLVSQTQFAVLKPAILASGIFWGSLAFISTLRLWQQRITEEKKLGLTFILGIFITPFVVPNFFLQNYCIYVPAGIVALTGKWSHEGYWELKAILRQAWLMVNIFVAPFFVAKLITVPLVLIFFLLLFYRRLLIITEAIRQKEAIAEVSMVDRR